MDHSHRIYFVMLLHPAIKFCLVKRKKLVANKGSCVHIVGKIEIWCKINHQCEILNRAYFLVHIFLFSITMSLMGMVSS